MCYAEFLLIDENKNIIITNNIIRSIIKIHVLHAVLYIRAQYLWPYKHPTGDMMLYIYKYVCK